MWLQGVVIISVLCVSSALSEVCDECKLYRSCPEAMRYAEVTTDIVTRNNQLKSTFCGVEILNGIQLPKVCCSEYRSSARWGINQDVKDETDDHVNAKLLPKDCGRVNGDRIYGGSVPNLYEFPWMVLISRRSRVKNANGNQVFKCGGSIINSRYILTAAHCVVNKTLHRVRVGEFDIDSKEDCQGEYPYNFCGGPVQDIPIEKVIPHESFRRRPSVNDIALLRLKEPIDFSHKNAAPICLPVLGELRNLSVGGKTATIAGWGATESNTFSSILLKVDIPVLTPESCRNQLPETNPNQLCAGRKGKDSCNGDSGGPLMIEQEVEGQYRIVQYGVVSYGARYCGTDTPGVYTGVANYMDWILDHIEP